MKCPQTRPLQWLFTNLTKLLVSKFLWFFLFLAFGNVNSASGYDFRSEKVYWLSYKGTNSYQYIELFV